jgi:hypothetical protein
MSSSLRAAELLVAGALFCCTTTAQAGVTPWEPIEIRGGQILFPVEIAGHAGRALFDTGASGNSVSRGFVEKAGLEMKGRRYAIEGAGSTDEYVPSISRLPIKLFGVEFKPSEDEARSARCRRGDEAVMRQARTRNRGRGSLRHGGAVRWRVLRGTRRLCGAVA